MIERLKEVIDINRYDKEVYNSYIEAFTTCDKAKEIYKDNDDFIELSNNHKKEEDKVKEDKYF